MVGENNTDSTLSTVNRQESVINDLLIPREEFTFIDDPESLEEIVIYDMVIEYQATINVNKNIDDDIIEIKAEPQEKEKTENPTSISQTEIISGSQMTIDHEEITSAWEQPWKNPRTGKPP